MKLREWLNSQGEMGKALTCKGGGLDYFTTFLDAEVIGLPCKACGGSGECVGCGGRGGMNGTQYVRGYAEDVYADCGLCGGTGTCPDCADAPITVIAPEAMEAAAKMVMLGGWTWDEVDEHSRQHCREAVRAVLQALLPGARVATEIGQYVAAGDVYTQPWIDSAKQSNLVDGTLIAVLAKQEEVEG